MIVVMPMVGRGERFRLAGFTIPKPLIPVDGEPMFVRATRSLPLALASRLVFAILEEHVRQFRLDREIEQRFGHLPLRIVVLPAVTSGQAETVDRAVADEDPGQPLLVFNADSAFEDDLDDYLPRLAPDVAGMLQVFTSTESRWSFARCARNFEVVETAEKRPISSLASTGLYYFRRVDEFRDLYRHRVRGPGETYIAPMYNQLIASGRRVVAKPVKRFLCFGTPEDYRDYIERGRAYGFVPA